MESPAIAKRKPPSQRPELKMDETAAAIARLREEAKATKPSKEDRLASDEIKSSLGGVQGGASLRKASALPASNTTRRQKTGGG
jgi:hypothetical protein